MTSWPRVPIRELGTVVTGSTPRTSEKKFYGGDIPFVTPADLDGFDPITETSRMLSDSGGQELKLVPPNSVLVSCIGSLGKVGISGKTLGTNQQINSVVFREARIWPRYGFYACRLLAHSMESIAPATTLPIVSKSKFEALTIPVPPMAMQKKIAETLDKADRPRRLRLRSLQSLSELRESVFAELFGEMNSSTGKWPLVPFEEIVSETKLGLVRSAKEYGPDFEVPYVRMDSISKKGELDLSIVQRTFASREERKQFSLQNGDFLFNTRNSKELVGKVAVFRDKGEYIFNNNIMRIRFGDSVDCEYVLSYFLQKFAQNELENRKAGTTSVFAIYWSSLRSLPVPLPPVNLQHRFSQIAVKIEAVKSKMSAHGQASDALFDSLVGAAFGGES